MTRISWDDNPFTVAQCIGFWEAWAADKSRGYDLQFVNHMLGWMHAHWMLSEYRQRPIVDLLLTAECPFKDSKGKPWSKSEVRRCLPRIAVNDEPLTDETLLGANLINDSWAVIRVGKRQSGDYWIVGVL